MSAQAPGCAAVPMRLPIALRSLKYPRTRLSLTIAEHSPVSGTDSASRSLQSPPITMLLPGVEKNRGLIALRSAMDVSETGRRGLEPKRHSPQIAYARRQLLPF